VNLSQEHKNKLQELHKNCVKNYEYQLSPEFLKAYKNIKEDPSKTGLYFQVVACMIKLQHDPAYPGLNSHHYDALDNRYHAKVWESYVQNDTPGAFRIFWHYTKGQRNHITLVALTPHP
jgi:hypothetical protein